MKPFPVILATAALTLAGIASVPGLSVSRKSVDGPTSVSIWFSNRHLSARTLEKEITSRIEGLCSTIGGIAGISSESSDGSGWVSIGLKKGSDIQSVRFETSLKMRQLRQFLPEDTYVDISGSSPESNLEEIMEWTVLSDLPQHVTDSTCMAFLRNHILGIPGVGRIFYQGNDMHGHDIVIDPAKTIQAGLSPSAVMQELQYSSSGLTVGSTPLGSERIPITVTRKETSPGNITLRGRNGRLFSMEEFATVTETAGSASYRTRINGLQCGVISVYPTSRANTLRICRRLREQLQSGIQEFPAGIHMECAMDSSLAISREIRKSLTQSGASLLILLTLLCVIYRNRKYVAVILFSLVADVSVTALICRIAGIGIDLSTLSALSVSLGMLIDTSIVMASDYMSSGNRKAAPGILTAVLTTAASLLLVFLLPESQRRELDGFIWTAAISLCVSFLTAWLTVPAMLELWNVRDFTGTVPYHRKRSVTGFVERFSRIILFCTRFRIPMLILSFSLAFFSVVHCYSRNTYHTPDKPEERNVLVIQAYLEAAKPAELLQESVSRMERRIALFPEIGQFRTYLYGNRATIRASFSPETDTWEISEIRDSLWKYALFMPQVAWTIPGLSEGQERYSTYFDAQDWTDYITIYGYDYEILNRYAGMVLDSLAANSRVRNPGISDGRSSGKAPDGLRFRPDMRFMAQNSIGLQELVNGMNGQGMTYNLRNPAGSSGTVRFTTETDAGLWLAHNQPITASGMTLRLENAGKLDASSASPTIRKENQEYTVDIGYRYIGDDLGHYSMRDAIFRSIVPLLPLGFRMEGSSWNSTSEGQASTLLLAVAVLAIIFLICCAMFDSIRIPFAIMTLVPVSIAGIFLIYDILEIRPGQSCFAAIAMTGGLAVNSGIYIAMEYLRPSRCSHTPAWHMARAFSVKAAPTALTIISTMLGLTPFAVTGNRDDFWYMLSVGMMGGLFLSAAGLITLFPALISLKKIKNASENSEKGNIFTRSFRKTRQYKHNTT